jgi:hypothetical protein
MATHEFNVYETLDKLHALMANGDHEDPSVMDKAEYSVLTSRLVRGALEILRHLAQHDILMGEANGNSRPIEPEDISEVHLDQNAAFSELCVNIDVTDDNEDDEESELLDQIAQIVDTRPLTDAADMLVLMNLWTRHLQLSNDSKNEPLTSAVFARWEEVADDVVPRTLRMIHQMQTAGILLVTDIRTSAEYEIELVRLHEDDPRIDLVINTRPEIRAGNKPLTSAKKKSLTPRN